MVMVPLKASGVLRWYDELNLARLSLVLALNRTTLQTWSRKIQLDEKTTLTTACRADHGNVVPHGIDNDVLLGLISAAVLQNVIPGGEVRLTVKELIKLSCLGDNARTYLEVHDSIRRLKGSTMTITERSGCGPRG